MSFLGGAPRLHPPLDHDIVVIDDFWADAPALRAAALAAPFRPFLSPSGFAFHEWKSPTAHTRRLADLVARACGAQLLAGRCDSRFVYETAADERKTREKVWVHYDRWQRVGVLYLVPNPIARGGTGFYRHRGTGMLSVEEADAAGLRPAVMADSTRDDRWTLVDQVPIRFNRMVVFKPHIFHQALNYFGTAVEDARLYNVVAFDRA